MGAIVTIPLILLFILLSPKKVNKEPRLTQFKQSPALKGNPKQNGQPLGIKSTDYYCVIVRICYFLLCN